MPRILNINLPNDKSIQVGLTGIPGIGTSRSKLICSKLHLSHKEKMDTLSKEQLKKITDFIDQHYVIGSKLFREKTLNIKNLIRMSSYKGFRHVRGLPSRGQRTHTNAKTSRKYKIKL